VPHVLASAAALVLLGAIAVIGWGVAGRLVPDGIAARACAAVIVAGAFVTVGFEFLARIGQFGLPAALVLATGAALATLKWSPPDVRGVSASARSAAGAEPWLAAGIGVVWVFLAARGLALPPLGWDALTYHLVHAGRWVQAGGFAPEAAPDGWSYYEYFPYVGEIPWAWAMLPWHGDPAVGLVSVGIAAASAGAAATVARELGADTRAAAGCGLATATIPALVRSAEVAYVDGTLLLAWACALVFVIRTLRAPSAANALLAGAGLGLCAGIKLSAMPLVAVGMAAGLAGIAAGGGSPGVLAARITALTGPLAIGAPAYVRGWVEKGSPFWPTPVSLGFLVFAGDPNLTEIQGRKGPTLGELAWEQLFALTRPESQHLNVGPMPLLLAIPAAIGGYRLLADRSTRAAGAAVIAASAAFLAMCLAPSARAYMAWAGSGRFLLPGVLGIVLLGIPVLPRPARIGVIAISLAFALPRPHGYDAWLALQVAAVLVGLAGLLAIERRPFVIGAAAWAGLAAIGALHDAHRWEAYERADAKRPLFVRSPLSADLLCPSLWEALDADGPHRVALSSGHYGQNWYRYPVMGARLGNTVVYVPPTPDGAVPARDWDGGDIDGDAWIARLRAAGVDRVLLASPPAVEKAVADAHPEVFTPLGEDGENALYAFQPP
jgi:hypothetical protein